MFKSDMCTLCGCCIAACPNQVNSIADGKFVLDRSRCNACGSCVSVCLNEARKVEGKTMTAEEVMATVIRDAMVYENSGGGITLSGGEPTVQPEFAVALLMAAHDEGIHTAVEITGAFPWEAVKKITDHADFILYDLKCIDEKLHKEGVGVSNKHVLENARNLAKQNKRILFRTPLIPGYNDSLEEVGAIASFVRELGMDPAEHLELLAYNNLGEDKYSRLDFEGERPSYQRQSNEYLDELNALCASI